MSNYIMFGVDGEVPPYERQKWLYFYVLS
jgi:hypothetical protein